MTGSEHLQNCSSCGVFPVCSGHYLSKVVQGRNSVNQRQGHGLIDARGERRLACVVRSIRWATVAQTAQEVNAGSDRKVSEYTVHRSLLRMGLHSCRSVRVLMLTPFFKFILFYNSLSNISNTYHKKWFMPLML